MTETYAKQADFDKLFSKIDQFVEKAGYLYARQSDLDKLTDQVERFVNGLNNLFITKELHEMSQKGIAEKLDKIEKMLTDCTNRLEPLEKKEFERKGFIRAGYWLFGVISAICSINLPSIIKKFFP